MKNLEQFTKTFEKKISKVMPSDLGYKYQDEVLSVTTENGGCQYHIVELHEQYQQYQNVRHPFAEFMKNVPEIAKAEIEKNRKIRETKDLDNNIILEPTGFDL